MIAQPQPLIEVFTEIPGKHCCRGQRHPLPSMAMASAVSLGACGASWHGADDECSRMNLIARQAEFVVYTIICHSEG